MNPPNLSQAPLPMSDIPGPMRRHCDPQAPPPLRDMGAKGLVPGITPEHLALVLYQLQFDPAEPIQTTARNTLTSLPRDMAQTIARSPLPAPVLDLCARLWITQPAYLQLLLTNNAVDDATFQFVAHQADGETSAIICDNQVRIQRSPAIVAFLYMNPNTPQSNINRVLEFALRQSLDLSGFPVLKSALQGLQKEQSLPSTQPAEEAAEAVEAAPAPFEHLLKESAQEADVEVKHAKENEDNLRVPKHDLRKEAPEEEEDNRVISLQVQIQNMNIAQKVRLASLGNKQARSYLIRDQNRLVHMAVITSPKITPMEYYDFAANKNLPEGVINYIASRKDAMRDYKLLSRLVTNPKLHLRTAIRMLNYLRANDLKSLAKNRNISPQVAKAAKQLATKREKKR